MLFFFVERRETSTPWRKADTTPASDQPQSKTTNSPPASSSTTLEQDKQQTHSSHPLGAQTFLILSEAKHVILHLFITTQCTYNNNTYNEQ